MDPEQSALVNHLLCVLTGDMIREASGSSVEKYKPRMTASGAAVVGQSGEFDNNLVDQLYSSLINGK